MSSKRRRAASRANGKKSHGPVTPEGKARSAANATPRHGLTMTPERAAHAVCLTNENPAEFTLLHQALVARHAPANITEDLIVHEMAVSRWRLNRAWTMETALLDNQMDHSANDTAATYKSTDDATQAALAFRKLAETSPALALLLRYETRLSRQFERCLKTLAALRATDKKVEFPGEPNPTNEHWQNDIQLQDQHPAPAAQPPPGPERGRANAPPETTSQVAPVSPLDQPDDSEPWSEPAPAFPRAA